MCPVSDLDIGNIHFSYFPVSLEIEKLWCHNEKNNCFFHREKSTNEMSESEMEIFEMVEVIFERSLQLVVSDISSLHYLI